MRTRFAQIIAQVRKTHGLKTEKTYTDPIKGGRRTSLMLEWGHRNSEKAKENAAQLKELFNAEGVKSVVVTKHIGIGMYSVERICIYMSTEDRKKLGCNDTVYERYAK